MAGSRTVSRAVSTLVRMTEKVIEGAGRNAGALLLLSALLGAPAIGATITVNSSSDAAGGPSCTLRNALTAANTNAAAGGCPAGSGADAIEFAIVVATDPGCTAATGVCRIQVNASGLGALPILTSPVEIRGYTQPGATVGTLAPAAWPNATAIDAQLRIEIDGSLVSAGFAGFQLDIGSAGSTLSGLSIYGFHSGITLNSGSNVVTGNFLGVRADGLTAQAMTYGVQIGSSGNTIGGTTAASRNLVKGSTGVFVNGGNANTIQGNLIGTDRTGTVSMGGSLGILVRGTTGSASNTLIRMNVVSGNDSAGISLLGTASTTVRQNAVGIGVGGVPLGNSEGIEVADNAGHSSTQTTITENGVANSTAGNGIYVHDAATAGVPSGVNIDGGNAFWSNALLGIDLVPAGEVAGVATPNDPLDADSGPNGLQNSPVVTSATVNGAGGVDVAFTLDSTASEAFWVAAWANADCSAASAHEGRYPAGGSSPTFSTDASGHYAGSLTIPAPLPAGWAVGAGITMNAVSTTTASSSELSGCVVVTGGVPDTTPDPFTFTDVTDAPLSTMVASAPVTVSGINAPTSISRACVGSCTFRINGGMWLTGSNFVVNGDVVEARILTSGTHGTLSPVVLTIGGVSDSFDVTTAAADTTPDPFTFVDVPVATPSATYVSAPVTVAGIDAGTAISLACFSAGPGCGYRVNGGAFQTAAGTVNAGDTVEARVNAPAISGNASATVTIGGVSDSYDVNVPRGLEVAVPAVSEAGLLGLAALVAAAGALVLRARG